MIQSRLGRTSAILVTLLLGSTLAADETDNKSAKVLEVGKSTEKLEVRASQIGYRDTLLFFTFPAQKTVLKLQIDNKNTTFPMTGTVYVFADTVDVEGIKMWLNNQHSDGLFPEVPEPKTALKLPAKSCQVSSHKLVDHTKELFGEYDNYDVSYAVKDFADKGGLTLKGFTGTSKVHVKTK